MSAAPPPVVWSVAGLDSGGGAGLSADQRAADAAGVHLCPVTAALTAQSSVAVDAVHPVPPGQLHAQLAALEHDLPPAALKTGLLGSVDNVRAVAQWVDRLRRRGPLALVVDPVLRASSGASFADAALIEAYRRELLPRASVITPNRREAAALVGHEADVPTLAQALHALGAQAVCITGGDAPEAHAQDWWTSAHASGWLRLPRRPSRHTHGTGCTFATGLAAALARGHAAADAAVIAKMLTTSGLLGKLPTPGRGPGPVRPHAGFISDATLLPTLSACDVAGDALPAHAPHGIAGVYGITHSATQLQALVQAGLRSVQLRAKRPPGQGDAAWREHLLGEISHARAAAHAAGATLVVNDHWPEAVALGARWVHLGQEDLLALDAEGRARLAQARRDGLRLGISTHSLWELAHAAAWRPDYVACGPVWPTLTKAMPWRAQGLHNLAWWVAMSPAPVVAIGGILTPPQLAEVAATGASAGCVLRGLQPGAGPGPQAWLRAWHEGHVQARQGPRGRWPQPTLGSSP